MTDFRNARTSVEDAGEEATDSSDSKEVRQYLGFVLGAMRRRKLLAAFVAALVMAGTVGLIRITPKSYRAETKILAERQQTLPSIMRSNSADEAPTHAAFETIHRRDNLISIIEKTQLLEKWPFPETAGLSADQKLNILAKLLDLRLSVVVGDGTVAIAIDWPDGRMAYELVEAARQSFLEARQVAEISSIEDFILVLEARAETLRSEIDSIEAESQRQAAKESAAGLSSSQRKSSYRSSPTDAVARQLKSEIEAKRRTIREIEDSRRRRREDLEAQLAKEEANYGKAYPSVISLQEQVEAFSKEPRHLATLRAEVQQLESVYSRRAGKSESNEGEPTSARRKAGGLSDEADDIDARMRSAQRKYETWLEKIESARIDLDTARTFFNRRYSVISPAMVPTEPDKPNVRLYLILGFVLAFSLAALATTAADIRAGRIVERWQIERFLDLPILGEVEKP